MQNLANAPAPSFLGYPIVTTLVMADDPSTNYNGAAMIAFGNLSLAATVATRRDVRVQLSEHRWFELDQIGIKGTMCHDFNVHDLGSNSVKSPFSVLVGTAYGSKIGEFISRGETDLEDITVERDYYLSISESLAKAWEALIPAGVFVQTYPTRLEKAALDTLRDRLA